MATREFFLRALLWYNVLSLAVWFGGTVYQMLVIVPMWSAAPPESVTAFFGGTAYNQTIRHFFGPMPQLLRALPLFVLLGLGWSHSALRPWLTVSAVAMLIALLMTRAYIYSINDVLFTKAGAGLGRDEVRELVRRWIFADRLRFAIMSAGYVCLLKAFSLSLVP